MPPFLPETRSGASNHGAERWLVGGGEMGKLIRPWTGPHAARSHRVVAAEPAHDGQPLPRLELPDLARVGAQHTQIYNDGYWPICGAKHPASMGQDFTECWASAWPVIGEAFERALRGRDVVPREPADVPGPQRLPRGDVLHVLVQPDPRRVGRRRRPVPPGHRDDRQDAERAAHAPLARPRRTDGQVALGSTRRCARALDRWAADELDLPFVLFYETASWRTARCWAAPASPPVRASRRTRWTRARPTRSGRSRRSSGRARRCT